MVLYEKRQLLLENKADVRRIVQRMLYLTSEENLESTNAGDLEFDLDQAADENRAILSHLVSKNLEFNRKDTKNRPSKRKYNVRSATAVKIQRHPDEKSPQTSPMSAKRTLPRIGSTKPNERVGGNKTKQHQREGGKVKDHLPRLNTQSKKRVKPSTSVPASREKNQMKQFKSSRPVSRAVGNKDLKSPNSAHSPESAQLSLDRRTAGLGDDDCSPIASTHDGRRERQQTPPSLASTPTDPTRPVSNDRRTASRESFGERYSGSAKIKQQQDEIEALRTQRASSRENMKRSRTNKEEQVLHPASAEVAAPACAAAAESAAKLVTTEHAVSPKSQPTGEVVDTCDEYSDWGTDQESHASPTPSPKAPSPVPKAPKTASPAPKMQAPPSNLAEQDSIFDLKEEKSEDVEYLFKEEDNDDDEDGDRGVSILGGANSPGYSSGSPATHDDYLDSSSVSHSMLPTITKSSSAVPKRNEQVSDDDDGCSSLDEFFNLDYGGSGQKGE